MSRSVTFDRARWNSQSQRLATFLRRKQTEMERRTEEISRDVARQTAAQLAIRTFPHKFGVHLAKLAIQADVHSVYITAGRAYGVLNDSGRPDLAKSFYAAYKRGDLATARDILRRSNTFLESVELGSLDPSLHQRARTGKDGHVAVEHPLQLVPSEQLDRYVEQVFSHIGRGAAGWSACAAQLGGEAGIPAYKSTSIHGSDGGHVTPMIGAGRVGWILHNTVPYARRLISPGQIARIKREANELLANRLRDALGLRDAA